MEHNPVYRLINVLANKQRRNVDQMAFPGKITPAQARVLHYILKNAPDEVFQKDIEEEFALRPPTATQLLKTMEKNELLRREPSVRDARFKKIVISQKAKPYYEPLCQHMDNLEERLGRGIPAEDLEVWKRVSETMIENL